MLNGNKIDSSRILLPLRNERFIRIKKLQNKLCFKNKIRRVYFTKVETGFNESTEKKIYQALKYQIILLSNIFFIAVIEKYLFHLCAHIEH